ncbi:hypothetical protein HCZ30_01895 [Marivivens donghaensis]|uniref:Secreted protein n=1 Tax=Marivivens donghaensis TaxID=1699413 RepID=A0ABX0VT75_9RHOB|nr:hypothetical protein [Marivivens donghaensis]NIY71181.1 hypothetical protein [Marivivens donghaensis]
MKKFTLAAAAAATMIASSAFALSSADAYFDETDNVVLGSEITLETVMAPADGVISIYDYSGNEQGALLGTDLIDGGLTSNVVVDIDDYATTDQILVTLTVDGEVVASKTMYTTDM